MDTLINIAPRGTAFQSSFSRWSHSENEANDALYGNAQDGYAFHTGNGSDEWWCVDLKKVYPLHSLKVYLREGYEARYPNDSLEVFVSRDLSNWEFVGCLKTPILYYPALLSLENKQARFLKIATHNNYLHFKHVEIFSDNLLISFRNLLITKNEVMSPTVTNTIEEEIYDGREIDTVLKFGSEDDSFLELGASLGIMSTCVKAKFPNCQYVAVEANPKLINIIHKNHKLNGINGVKILNAAISDRDGKAMFYLHRDCWSSSLIEFPYPTEIVTIDLLDFNGLLSETKSNFLICDIEGGEYIIFNDSVNLENITKICIEVHNAELQKTQALFNLFINKGFKTESRYPIKPGGGVWYFHK